MNIKSFSTHVLATAFLGASLLPLAGCATTDDNNEPKGIAALQGDPRLGEKVNQLCFARSLDGFSDTTDRTVVLSKGVRDDYIVEVFGPCDPLRDALSIVPDGMGGCLGEGDNLIVSDNLGMMPSGDPFSTERCAIKSIHKWNSVAKPETGV